MATHWRLPLGSYDKRQQCQVAGTLDGHRELALMLGAGSCLPPRANLSPVGQVVAQYVDLLVIDMFDLLFAEATGLASPAVPPATATAAPAARAPVPPA